METTRAVVGGGRLAAAGLSGGLLAVIWSGVWTAAMLTGRVETTRAGEWLCRFGFAAGLTAAVGSFLYLRSRRLSLMDGSDSHPPLTAADRPSGLRRMFSADRNPRG